MGFFSRKLQLIFFYLRICFIRKECQIAVRKGETRESEEQITTLDSGTHEDIEITKSYVLL